LHYRALSDDEWGEHEIDHILVAQKDVKFTPNAGEVMATQYVNPEQLKELFKKRNAQLKQTDLKSTEKLYITPWFEIICNEFLFKWWENLATIIKDQGLREKSDVIHRISLPSDSGPTSSPVTKPTNGHPSPTAEGVEKSSKKRKLESE